MPRPADETDRTAAALRIYEESPMRDGDVVLLVDDSLCMEVAGLADHWDPVTRDHTVLVLRTHARRVTLAIARRGADLSVSDYAIWSDLHRELEDDVELLPLKALPAA